MNLLGFGTKNKISIVKDPFGKDKVKTVHIHYMWNEWQASIEFKNGNTEGKQNFTGYKPDEFDRMVSDMKIFMNSL